MLFPEKIVSINQNDKVLEVGPGGTPHPRSDVLLEKVFLEQEAKEQRGHTDKLQTDKELVFYEGDRFPFGDNEFDYVICSHVLEHVPADEIMLFISELQRVAPKGYIEYPTIYYEYLYNFKVHVTLLHFQNGRVYYMDKAQSQLNSFYTVQTFFYKTLESGYDELVRENKKYFFQGFEWDGKLIFEKTDDIRQLTSPKVIINKKGNQGGIFPLISYIRKFFR